jgi:hypothetical protein
VSRYTTSTLAAKRWLCLAHVPHPLSIHLYVLAYRPEDQYFVELRQDLFGSIRKDEDEEVLVHSLAFQLFPFGLFAGLGVAWFVKKGKKIKRQKTGRHKKIEN